MSQRFLILGADRETGKPASLVLEADDQASAEDFAARQGILIRETKSLPGGSPPAAEASRAPIAVTDRRGAMAAEETARSEPAPASGADDWREEMETEVSVEHIPLPYRGAPRVPALPGEQVLATYEPTRWELGLRCAMFGHKRALILTTHRLLAFDRRLLGATLETCTLDSLDGMTLGSRIVPWMFVTGLSGIALAIVQAIPAMSSSSSASNIGQLLGMDLSGAQSLVSGASSFILGASAILGVMSLMLILASMSRELAGYCGGRRCGVSVRWLSMARGGAFLGATEEAIAAVRKGR